MYQLTDSPLYLGLTVLMRALPLLTLPLLRGGLADRVPCDVPYRLVITDRGQVNRKLRVAPPGIQGAPGEIVSVDEMALQPEAPQTIDVRCPRISGPNRP